MKQTAANKGHKKCALVKPLKGSFSVSGAAGPNSFKFSGKLGGKALKPGPTGWSAAPAARSRKPPSRSSNEAPADCGARLLARWL